jgi:hypothetical protein
MGQIYDSLNMKKCGDKCYEPKNQTCCLNKVYEGVREMKPCGKYDCYDARNQTCTKGQISNEKPAQTTSSW